MKLSLIWIKRQSKEEDSFLEEYLEELKFCDVEKIVVGHTDLIRDDFIYIPFYEHGLDDLGLICHKKNIGVLASSGDICVVMHIDTKPSQSFFEEINKILFNDNVVICPIGMTESGSRSLTWCLYAGKHKDPNESFCDSSYISGACLIAQKKLLLKYKWDQNRKHNQEEDYELSKRMHANGVDLICNPDLKVIMKNSQ